MYQLEAVIRILEKKCYCSNQEILEELELIKREETERKRVIKELKWN